MSHRAVLIVEDEKDVLDVMAEMVTFFGYGVKAMTQGLKALEEISRGEYEMIITDLGLPDIEGAELVRRVRAAAIDTPIIVVTGVEFDAIEHGLGNMKSVKFLQKPFKMEDLRNAIKTAILSPAPRAVKAGKQK